MASDLLQNLNQLYIESQLSPLSEDQFDVLMESVGVQTLWRLCQEASRDGVDASREALNKWHRIALMTCSMRLLGFEQVTARSTASLVKANGIDLIANIIGAARSNRDPTARRRLTTMIENAAGEPAPAAQDDVPPPRQFEQQPPPPGRQTHQAFDAGDRGAAADSQVATPRQGGYQRNERQQGGRDYPRDDRQRHRPSNNVSNLPRRAEATNRPSQDDGGDRPGFDQQNVYSKGSSGASVRFQSSEDKRTEGRFVVFVEFAHINQDGSTYNWNDKLSLMLNTSETERAILVLTNKLPIARFSAHGGDRKKWMQILSQAADGRYSGCKQITGGDGQRSFLCNMSPIDQSKMLAVLQRAYARMIELPLETAMKNLEAIAENYFLEFERTPDLVEQVRRNGQPRQNGGQQGGNNGGQRDRQHRGSQEPRYGSHRG